MSYLKLCQLVNQSLTEIFYQEDCDGNILVNNIQGFPLSLHCEVIDWVSQEEFEKRGQTISFTDEIVEVPNGQGIRQQVFDILVVKYPALVI